MLRSDRRTFLGLLSSLAGSLASKWRESQQPVIEVRPTALFQQPEGRKNLGADHGLRVERAGGARAGDGPSRRAGRTAGLLPSAQGVTLSGEVWGAASRSRRIFRSKSKSGETAPLGGDCA